MKEDKVGICDFRVRKHLEESAPLPLPAAWESNLYFYKLFSFLHYCLLPHSSILPVPSPPPLPRPFSFSILDEFKNGRFSIMAVKYTYIYVFLLLTINLLTS
jgi:hypothetical protein